MSGNKETTTSHPPVTTSHRYIIRGKGEGKGIQVHVHNRSTPLAGLRKHQTAIHQKSTQKTAKIITVGLPLSQIEMHPPARGNG